MLANIPTRLSDSLPLYVTDIDMRYENNIIFYCATIQNISESVGRDCYLNGNYSYSYCPIALSNSVDGVLFHG